MFYFEFAAPFSFLFHFDASRPRLTFFYAVAKAQTENLYVYLTGHVLTKIDRFDRIYRLN